MLVSTIIFYKIYVFNYYLHKLICGKYITNRTLNYNHTQRYTNNLIGLKQIINNLKPVALVLQ